MLRIRAISNRELILPGIYSAAIPIPVHLPLDITISIVKRASSKRQKWPTPMALDQYSRQKYGHDRRPVIR
jgi:hypothetical protein